jgi:hypothetical protein
MSGKLRCPKVQDITRIDAWRQNEQIIEPNFPFPLFLLGSMSNKTLPPVTPEARIRHLSLGIVQQAT